jgi:hypothetical protein
VPDFRLLRNHNRSEPACTPLLSNPVMHLQRGLIRDVFGALLEVLFRSGMLVA